MAIKEFDMLVGGRKAGVGFNCGHTWMKVVVLCDTPGEVPGTTVIREEVVVFRSLVAKAPERSDSDLIRLPTVKVNGMQYVVGEDALRFQANPEVSQARINSPIFIPALIRAAINQLERNRTPAEQPAAILEDEIDPNDVSVANTIRTGRTVTGLPATWSLLPDLKRTLAERIRGGLNPISTGPIRVIPEPVGGVYGVMLDNNGEVGDDKYVHGKVAVADFGGGTVDAAVVTQLLPDNDSLMTTQLGTVRPIAHLQQMLGALLEYDLSFHQVEDAIRTGTVLLGGSLFPLPEGWERPFTKIGMEVRDELKTAWKKGLQFDAILLVGGGAEIAPMMEPILDFFPKAQVVPDAQLAVARGYSQFARRLANQQG